MNHLNTDALIAEWHLNYEIYSSSTNIIVLLECYDFWSSMIYICLQESSFYLFIIFITNTITWFAMISQQLWLTSILTARFFQITMQLLKLTYHEKRKNHVQVRDSVRQRTFFFLCLLKFTWFNRTALMTHSFCLCKCQLHIKLHQHIKKAVY